MGVKIKLFRDDLPLKYKKYDLIESKNGVSDTVYILENSYVLKLFHNSSLESIKNELKLLELCKDLSVVEVDKTIYLLKSYPALFYKKCNGLNLRSAKTIHIKQIAKFLKKFHTITKNKKSTNANLW